MGVRAISMEQDKPYLVIRSGGSVAYLSLWPLQVLAPDVRVMGRRPGVTGAKAGQEWWQILRTLVLEKVGCCSQAPGTSALPRDCRGKS